MLTRFIPDYGNLDAVCGNWNTTLAGRHAPPADDGTCIARKAARQPPARRPTGRRTHRRSTLWCLVPHDPSRSSGDRQLKATFRLPRSRHLEQILHFFDRIRVVSLVTNPAFQHATQRRGALRWASARKTTKGGASPVPRTARCWPGGRRESSGLEFDVRVQRVTQH